MRLHSATKIVLWLTLAVSLQTLGPLGLTGASAVLALLAVLANARGLIRLLRRTRWLLLSLILIYGFSSPGTALDPAWGGLSPTWEGLRAGALQAWRLAALLTALSVLLATTSRDDLLQGLYVLLRPGRRFGLDVDRVALRTWLTLDYADRLARLPKGRGWRGLQEALFRVPPGPSRVALAVGRFGRADLAVLALAAAILAGLLAR